MTLRIFPTRKQILQAVETLKCKCGFVGPATSFVIRNGVRKCLRCHGCPEIKVKSRTGQIVSRAKIVNWSDV